MTDSSPRPLGVRPRVASGLDSRLMLTRHHRYEALAYPGWSSYASQEHIRDIDVDTRRGWMWMATWGGVLCWIPDPAQDLCVRYTSANGLIGNATRSLTVDPLGSVWAGGQNGGLCRFSPGADEYWQSVDVQSWVSMHLAPRLGGGVYSALCMSGGEYALGEIAPPEYKLRLWQDSLATREIQAVLVDEDGVLWLGNLWGLHRQNSDGTFVTVLDLPVLTLDSIGPMLWIGTDHGVHSFRSGQDQTYCEPDWPLGRVTSLTIEPTTGSKWLVTEQDIGRIIDNAWHPLPHFSTVRIRLNKLLVGKPDLHADSSPTRVFLGEHQIWGAGTNEPRQGTVGLYRIGIDDYQPAFGLDSEDQLSNAVQFLWADETAVWVGAARGLYSFDGRSWRNYTNEEPSLRDVRAISSGHTSGSLLVGSGQTGIHHLQSGVPLPGKLSSLCILAILADVDGTLWAATPDDLLYLSPGTAEWNRANQQSTAPAIQALCKAGKLLWVGTADGLWKYDPELKTFYPPADSDPTRHLSIRVLAIDPIGGDLWAGTDAGLYRQAGGKWACLRDVGIQALAFTPEGNLWLGTEKGLEEWPLLKDKPHGERVVFKGKPLNDFNTKNSALAASQVTALFVRVFGNCRQVWIGSPAGVSCFEYFI